MQRAIVIGAGFGGIALAIRLQSAGIATTIVNRNVSKLSAICSAPLRSLAKKTVLIIWVKMMIATIRMSDRDRI